MLGSMKASKIDSSSLPYSRTSRSSAWGCLIRLKRIYNFWWFHAVILWTFDVLYTFYIFFGTNLLIQCQLPVPIFSVFLALLRSDFGTESKRNKIPEINFSRREEDQGAWGPSQEGYRGPTSPLSATRGAASRLVATLAPPWPSSFAYIFPKIQKKIKGSTKILFCRRKLPFPRDLIWRPFPVPCRRGFWSWRASSSTSSPLQSLVSSSLKTYGSVVSS